ncbi:MAG: hypothetical protein EOO06_21285 [Chitinophagaceae bacterium]|nr:MAG: hypothetical protein EOO06_21285 [Chitinophagaceae bacterium]
MNDKEVKTGKRYNEWTDIIDTVREQLNKIRRIDPPKETKDESPLFNEEISKYHIGQAMHYKLMKAKDALGHNQNTNQFREGDMRFSKETRTIQNIFVMRDLPRYRYQLKGMPQVSWYEEELMPAKTQQETYIVKAIVGKKRMNNQIYYKVWWEKAKKKMQHGRVRRIS